MHLNSLVTDRLVLGLRNFANVIHMKKSLLDRTFFSAPDKLASLTLSTETLSIPHLELPPRIHTV